MEMNQVKQQLKLQDGPSDSRLDDALELQATEEEYSKLLRKLDLILLPLMGICYMFQLLDKMSLNISTQLGLLQDLKFHGSQYSWASSIFYFGYFIWTWPVFWLAVRLPLGTYLAVSVFIWGAVLMCHGVCSNFAGFMTVRFFLGAAEAAVAPGFSLIVSMFYTRKEQPLRQGVWFAGNCVANILGGLMGYGIGHVNSNLAKWRVLFLILGVVTVALSVLLWFFLPDSPSKARFLNEREKTLALHRMLENQASILDEDTFITHQMWEALRDPQAWLLALYSFAVNICNGGITTFASLLVGGFGFGTLQTLLLQMPTGGLQLIVLGVVSILATTTHVYRTSLMVTVCAMSLTGMILVTSLDHSNASGRLVGIYLAGAFAVNIPMALSLIASNVGGYTKKATVNTMVFIGYSAGNIVGPQFFIASEAPIYEMGVHSTIAGFSLGIFFLLSLMLYYKVANYNRDKKFGSNLGASVEEIREDSCLGTTDMINTRFRYVA